METAVALNFLNNISDDDQRFTYYWNQSLAITSKGEGEMGGALSFGFFREPQDPDAWRAPASVNIGCISEQITNSIILTLIVPFGD
jgi:hypothetical protein